MVHGGAEINIKSGMAGYNGLTISILVICVLYKAESHQI